MKKQLIHIHGGESWATYDEYVAFLNTYDIHDPAEPVRTKWADTYEAVLGSEWLIMKPSMPAKHNAKYEEWKIWFEKFTPYLHNKAVLVGNSLGATFFAKYISEHTLPFHIGQLHLVAGRFFDRDETFRLDAALVAKNIEPQCDQIFIYHSQDDFVVPFEDAGKFKAALPSAELVTFEDRGHFLQPEFPELIARIRKN